MLRKHQYLKKNSSGEKNYKYFIGYLYNDHKVKSLHTVLPKTGAYVKLYDRETKWAHFLSEDDDLVEKYNTIWDSQCSYQKNLIAKLSTIKIF